MLLDVTVPVLGPWSLATSRHFWEGFAPAALTRDDAADGDPVLRTEFPGEADGRRVATEVRQGDGVAHVRVDGEGDLDAAVTQVARFLSLDVDARDWPAVARRDPVIADAQTRLPGLRPCGFHSPYEAAAWSVLAQRTRIVAAAALRRDLVAGPGEGAFPAPAVLRGADLDLPGRKPEYLRAVAEAALEGRLDAAGLRALPTEEAMTQVRGVHGLGPFASELVVLRGANAPDALPRHEPRLVAELQERYGEGDPDVIAGAWRPLRTWAVVHLRALREERT